MRMYVCAHYVKSFCALFDLAPSCLSVMTYSLFVCIDLFVCTREMFSMPRNVLAEVLEVAVCVAKREIECVCVCVCVCSCEILTARNPHLTTISHIKKGIRF